MITSQKPGITVRSKTGWTRTEGRHIGWWTGYMEHQGNVYFFCTRIMMPLGRNTDGFGKARKLITAEVLKALYGVEI
ncbi:hypothetical protein MKQ70_15295 [Chitinophaga sedimenti]|uniref:penicillin-binding transpeptidase domain-containing protein n=1 Tax=Chitinophaga sedimenti TaxID=2033606 RepID=UPI002006A702|nr:penicillin-binding transpeptidase domain-containing protein [Chitinophaga sedimenti]MCK7556307.1 hypothetical protein [Chitinophaga sedimenti]